MLRSLSRLRFRIRSLILVTTFSCIGLALVLSARKHARSKAAMIEQLQTEGVVAIPKGSNVTFDFNPFVPGGLTSLTSGKQPAFENTMLTYLVGQEGGTQYSGIAIFENLRNPDDVLALLRRLPSLETVYFRENTNHDFVNNLSRGRPEIKFFRIHLPSPGDGVLTPTIQTHSRITMR